MTFIAVRCPHCQSDQIVKRGKTARGTQRYLCQNTLCAKGSFLLDDCNRGCLPEVKQTIIDMRLNASGVRDTARALHICPPMKQRVRGRAGHSARAGEGDTHMPPVAFVLCGVCQVIARVQALVLQQKIISYTG